MNDGFEYEDFNVNVENGGKMAKWMTLAMKQRESSSAPAARPFERSVPLNLEWIKRKHWQIHLKYPSMSNKVHNTFEQQLFKAADKLRKNIDAAEYKYVVRIMC